MIINFIQIFIHTFCLNTFQYDFVPVYERRRFLILLISQILSNLDQLKTCFFWLRLDQARQHVIEDESEGGIRVFHTKTTIIIVTKIYTCATPT